MTEQEPWVLGWGTVFSKYEGRLGTMRFAASVRYEAISSAERGAFVFDPADRRLRRAPLSVRELWLRVPLAASLDLELGRLELGWGKTDGFSPADAFLPRDLSDPYADEKLPLWGARLRGQRGPVRFELFGSATTTPWRLPVLVGRQAPVDASFFGLRVYLVDGEQAPPGTGFAAVRALATLGDWDVGVWGRAGVRPAPLLALRLDRAFLAPDGIAVPADRDFAHESGAGVEASRVVGPFVLRAELAALFSSDARLGDALLWTLGAERSFGDGTLLVTFAANGRGTPIDRALLFDRAFLPGLIAAWTRSERWGSWKVVVLHAFRNGDGVVKAEVADDLTDTWRVTLGADLPYGTSAGVFGVRKATRRVHLAVRRSW